MPGLIKLGAVHSNDRTVQDRVNELFTTGVPEEFKIEFFAEVSDSRSTEKQIHTLLENYRNTSSREFFRIDADQAKDIITNAISDIEWSDKESVSSNKYISKRPYDRLSDLYTVVSDNLYKFVDSMKVHNYYESHSWKNEDTCNMLLQRLGYISESLERMKENNLNGIKSPYTQIDNLYMKKELKSIHEDVDRFKDTVSKHP